MATLPVAPHVHTRTPRVGPALKRVWQLLGPLVAVVVVLGKRAVTPHKVALANLLSMPLTVAGAGFIDFAAFHVGHGWGWLVTGISLIVVEHLIADETEGR